MHHVASRSDSETAKTGLSH